MTPEQASKLDQLLKGQEKIHRGLYGDPENNQKGLIRQQADDDQWRETNQPYIDALKDDEVTGEPGVISQTQQNTNYIKKQKTLMKAAGAGVGVSGGGIAYFAVKFWENIKQILHL